MKSQYSRALILIAILFVTLVPLHVAAKENEREPLKMQQSRDELPTKIQERVEQLHQKAETLHTKREASKKEAGEQTTSQVQTAPAAGPVASPEMKKKACDTNQPRINDTMSRLNNEKQRTYDRITKISESANQFYISRKLSINNYDSLLAAVHITQAAAKETLEAQHSSSTFDCDGNSPRTTIKSFQTKSEASKDALLLYRDAVKSLLVTIRDTYQVSDVKADKES